MSRSVAITGASGYLGSRLTSAFSGAGWDVIRLVRSPSRPTDRRMTLGERIDARVLGDVELLVHAAYDMGAITTDDIWRINVAGTEKLLDAARDADVGRIIVLSSMSAYEGTRQRYGRAKLEIEAMTLASGGAAVRPGLVVGGNPGGMAGTLAKLIQLPVTPNLLGAGGQFPVLEEDFVAGIMALTRPPRLPDRAVGLAHAEPLSFPALLRGIARYIGAKPPHLVPVPWRAVDMTLRAAEALNLRLPLRSDSLLGLLEPAPHVPQGDYWTSLGVSVKSLPA